MSKINSFINELEAQRLIQNHKYEMALPLLLDALRMGQYLSKETLLQNIALCYIKLEDYKTSLSYLNQVMEINPKNSAVQYNLAYSRFKLGLFEEARHLFLQIESQEGLTTDIAYYLCISFLIKKDEKSAEKYLEYLIAHLRGTELIYNMGIEMIQSGFPSAARIVFIRYLEEHPQDLDSTFGLGISYIENKDFHKAIECLKRVVSWNEKKYPSAFTMLGVAHFQIGEVKEAYGYIRDSLKLDQSSFEGWYYLGIIYEQTKQPEQALQSFHRAAEIQPESIEVWEHLGHIYFNKDDHDHALTAFKKAYQLSKDPKYAYQMGLIYMVKESFKKAVDYFTLSMHGDTFQDSLENISICYYHLKDYQKVIDMLSPLSEDRLSKAILHFILGSSLMKTGHIRESQACLEKGHIKYPTEVNILYSLGLLKANAEDFQQASRYFENALIISRQPEILYALALAKIQLDNQEEAVQYLDEYRLFCEKDTATQYKLGLLFLQLKAYTQARLCFMQVLQLSPDNKKARQYLEELEQY